MTVEELEKSGLLFLKAIGGSTAYNLHRPGSPTWTSGAVS